ncbi:hypothetical protein [Burkholderia multivorans]|uniref:hypothetical protein n=1 Tax=Burkholderia multivorans TaxID=87883 RepID=UPI0015E348F9|nr:hypothetical protein [Burkholderia multivorans]
MSDRCVVLWIVAGLFFNMAGVVGSFAAHSAWVAFASLFTTALIAAIAAIDVEGAKHE